MIQRFSAALLVSLMCACGGGGSGGGGGPAPANPPPASTPPPPAEPFGLTEREPLASLNLPTGGATLSDYQLVNAFPGLSFSAALYVTGVPGQNRLVVVQQSGEVVAFANDPATTATDVVLDISDTVVFAGEQGLLGLAFDPAFVQNRFVYLHYIAPNPRRSVIARMAWDANTDRIDATSEKIILEIEQPFTNHNGGMLAFGPDDFLYIAMGDGGSGGDPLNNAQNQTVLLGKLLRIDVSPDNPADPYDIPLDNPFVNDPGVRDEIYASGLRNPFRFSFDRQTGELWLGDVGQNRLEEIDIIQAGGNYGWRVLEGTEAFDATGNTLPPSAFTPPVLEYGRGEGVAVIGGYVYRGSALASLVGRYLYSDFGSGTVWALAWDGNQVTANDVIGSAPAPTSFGETNEGELLIVTRDSGLLAIEANSGGAQIPSLLSQTGLFTDLDNLNPASGLIEYSPQQPFWSDDAVKRRWLGVPDALQVAFTSDDWTLPPGTVTVKHFEINLIEDDPSSAKRLETRVLVNTVQGWQGFTYRWDSNGSDATLLSGGATEILNISTPSGNRQQLYEYPSRTDCLLCHTAAAGFTLSLKTPQLNGDFAYGAVVDNQLRSFNNISLFDTDIGAADQYETFPDRNDSSASIEARARTYLDVNCSQCHQPGGPAPTALDLRASTPAGAMNAIGVAPVAGNLGITDAQIIAAGDRQRSVLWQRMQRLDDARMPPLSSHVVDTQAVDIIGNWIDAL